MAGCLLLSQHRTFSDFEKYSVSEVTHERIKDEDSSVSASVKKYAFEPAGGTCQTISDIERRIKELKARIENATLADLVRWRKIKSDKKLGISSYWQTKRKIERYIEWLKKLLTRRKMSKDIQEIASSEIKIPNIDNLQTLSENIRKRDYILSHEIPLPPAALYGRDAFVEDIVNLLVSSDANSPRICIHGQGGMGKTSAALAVVWQTKIIDKFGEGCFWVPCVQATSPALFLHLLYSKLHVKLDTGDILADILRELNSSSSPRLVILDNFDTPWDSADGGQEVVQSILNQLSSLSHLSILVTTGANISPTNQIAWISKPLDVVDPEASYSIYCSLHPAAKGKRHLQELLVELGHIPFAITVVAKLGKTSKSKPAALLKKWRKRSLQMKDQEDIISRSIGLFMDSKAVINNAAAHTLLATLALLPAGTTDDRLALWTPRLKEKREAVVSALKNVSLIVETVRQSPESEDDADSDRTLIIIQVHPVVRSYMQQGERITAAVRQTVRKKCCQYIWKHSQTAPGTLDWEENRLALSAEEFNLQSILLKAIRQDDIMSLPVIEVKRVLWALIVLSWHQYYTRLPSRTDVIEHALEFARKFGNEMYKAESLYCLGNMLKNMKKYREACVKFIEAGDCFKKLSDTKAVCACSLELCTIYLHLTNPTLSKQVYRSLFEEDLGPAGGLLRARYNLARGEYYRYIREYPKALACFLEAKTVLVNGNFSRVFLADCRISIAGVFGKMSKFEDGLKTISKSLKLCEKYAFEDYFFLSLLMKSALLLCAEAPIDEVLPILECTLNKALLLRHPLGIATALELHGEMYAREKEVSLAIKFYREAEDKYMTMPEEKFNEKYYQNCQVNLERLAIVENENNREAKRGIKVKKLSVLLLAR